MTILAQTVQLAFKIAIVWTGGFSAGGCGERPAARQVGDYALWQRVALLVPFNRIGFWTCLLAAVTVTALVVVRGMLADIGWRSFQ